MAPLGLHFHEMVRGLERVSAWRHRMRQVVTKVLTDQLAFTPAGIGLFYGTMCTLEGRPEETVQVGSEHRQCESLEFEVWV